MSPDDYPLAFRPPRVYVLKDVWANSAAARRARRVCEACPGAEVRTFTYSDLPDIVQQEGWDHFPKMGEMEKVPTVTPVLVLARFDAEAAGQDAKRMQAAYTGDGSYAFGVAAGANAFTFFCSGLDEIKPHPHHVCRPQWRLHQGRGCPHECAYCGLGGSLISYVNTEEYIERLADLVRRNPWQKTWLYDDVMDVLTFEPQMDTVGHLMRFFESTGDQYLILHTKSDRVQGLIDAGAPKNTIIVWSLAAPTQSRQIERGAGTTDGRIEAARQCQEAGMTIRYKFKPIVPVRNWREEMRYTIDLALSRTRPDNLSMTSLMWMDVDRLKRCIPEALLDPEFLRAAEDAAEGMKDLRTGPFPDDLRETIYRHCLAEIRARDESIPVTLSTESLEMWRSLGADLGFSPADYVCGCGAGATPWKRRLDTNPWRDARAAVTWDGQAPRQAKDRAAVAAEPAE